MSKPKVSLVALAAKAQAEQQPTKNVVTLQRDDVATKKAAHTSLYLHPNVRKAIREIAFQYDLKPHDLYIEGIDLMLAKYGKPSTSDLSK